MKDAFYFPHFSNARHDRKVRRVRKELGVEGYGIFFMLLEILREQKDFCYPTSDIDLLAEEIGSSEQKVRTVICNYNLFDFVESSGEQCFSSINMIKYLDPYLQKKQLSKLYGIKGNLVKYGYLTKEKAKEMSLQQVEEYAVMVGFIAPESGGDSSSDRNKRKETKEINKTKETKENITNNNIANGGETDILDCLTTSLPSFQEYQPSEHKAPEQYDIDGLMKLWNDSGLPNCGTSYTLPNPRECLNAIKGYGEEYIKETILNLAENKDKIMEGCKLPAFVSLLLNGKMGYWHDWKEKKSTNPDQYNMEQDIGFGTTEVINND